MWNAAPLGLFVVVDLDHGCRRSGWRRSDGTSRRCVRLEETEARRGVLRVELEMRGVFREIGGGLVHRLHPAGELLHLIDDLIELGVRGRVLLLHRGHGSGDLRFHYCGALPGRQIGAAVVRSYRRIGITVAIRRSLPTTDGFTDQARPGSKQGSRYQLLRPYYGFDTEFTSLGDTTGFER